MMAGGEAKNAEGGGLLLRIGERRIRRKEHVGLEFKPLFPSNFVVAVFSFLV
jgi:hypothetical protein